MADQPDDTPYQSLYRRFRPSTFAEVQGQDHVVLALRNAVRDRRVAHAYLFSGPRGTGKTSTARILAKALNCTNPYDGEPCGVCSSCMEIAKGTSLDVHELDAASNNGVDAMRDLVSRAALGTPGRQKVYIVDEVHMLSTPASNALLKTLEEPPAHVVFVLATTDPQKVLPTIKSRTQHFEFRLLGPETLGTLLEQVRRDAHLDVPDQALELAVRRGRGSARDALSVLDQVAASEWVDDDLPELDEVIEALAEQDVGRALAAVAHLSSAGYAPQQLAGDLIDQLRQGFLALVAPELVSVSGSAQAALREQAQRVGLASLVRAMESLGRAQVAMRDAPDPRVSLEVALVRLTNPAADDSTDALLARIERLESALHAGAIGVAVPAAATPPQPPRDPAPPAPAARPTTQGAALAAPTTSLPAVARTIDPPAAPSAETAPPAADEREPAPSSASVPSRPVRTVGAARRQSPPPPPPPAASHPAVEAPAASPPGPAAPPPGPAAPPAGPAAPQAGPAAPPPQDPAPSSVPFPTRDQLVQAWGDHVIGRLRPKAKALFQAGRFVSVEDDRAVFGLPNAIHRTRCVEMQPEVESALGDHFGRPVALELVVDPGAAPAPPVHADTGGAPAAPPRPPRITRPPPVAEEPPPDPSDDDEDLSAFDESQLGEIAQVDNSAATRVLQAFPGAEEVR